MMKLVRYADCGTQISKTVVGIVFLQKTNNLQHQILNVEHVGFAEHVKYLGVLLHALLKDVDETQRQVQSLLCSKQLRIHCSTTEEKKYGSCQLMLANGGDTNTWICNFASDSLKYKRIYFVMKLGALIRGKHSVYCSGVYIFIYFKCLLLPTILHFFPLCSTFVWPCCSCWWMYSQKNDLGRDQELPAQITLVDVALFQC